MMSRMSSTLRTALTIVSLLVLAALPAACQLPAATPAPPATPPPAEAAPEPTVPAPAEPTAEASPEASADVSAAIDRAAAYLETQTLPEGGVDSFASGAADPTGTALAVTALAAAGRTDRTTGMVAYLAEQAVAYTHQAGEEGAEFLFPSRAGLLLLAVAAAGEDPATFGGQDLLGQLQAAYDPETGAYATDAQEEFTSGAASDVNQAWALLGLAAAGAEVPAEAGQYLIGLQGEDGSWGGSDPDTTARAVVALVGGGHAAPGEEAIENAIGFFRDTQLENGGWRPSWDQEPLNADTTGWVVQALLTAGVFPAEEWAREEGEPVAALLALQKEDGSIGGAFANAYSTAEALLALAGRPVVAPAAAGAAVSSGAAALPEGQVAVVVQFDEARAIVRLVPYAEGMTGLDALLGTGLAVDVAYSSMGAVVCAIDGQGSPTSDCFGQAPNTWAYWHWADGEWVYSSVGSAQYVVEPGAVEGWSWGDAVPPAAMTVAEIVSAADA
jgi:hypothetical protein